mgnify:CR=1 FL=1
MKEFESFEVPQPSKVNYINAQYGLKSWLLTRDHKRIALLYTGSITFFFFIGGLYAMMIRLELLTPQGDLLQSTTYNKVFHSARNHHGVFLPDSVNTGNARKFPCADDDGAKDLAFPRINSAELVHLPARRADHDLRLACRWCRYWLDLLRTVQHDVLELVCVLLPDSESLSTASRRS